MSRRAHIKRAKILRGRTVRGVNKWCGGANIDRTRRWGMKNARLGQALRGYYHD